MMAVVGCKKKNGTEKGNANGIGWNQLDLYLPKHI
jgi:hypothetical protein